MPTKTNKIPKKAREVALDVLIRVEEDKSYSNLELNESLRNSNLEKIDIGLVTELVYGTIQRQNTLDWLLQRFLKKPVDKLDRWVHSLLRMSAYQIWYLTRIPERAAIHEAVEIAKKRGHQGISGMVNGVLRNLVRQKDQIQIPQDLGPVQRIALQHSHPEWLVRRWIELYGEAETEAICQQNNEPPLITARVNVLRTTRDQLLEQLREAGFTAEASRVHPEAIHIRGGGHFPRSEWFRNGFCTIQDESSILVSQLVSPSEGNRVLDCCAAPGGKSTHMAELMGNHGEIVSADIHPHKLDLIRHNAERLGTTIVSPVLADATALEKTLSVSDPFDYILVDAPCSGLGVIRRKPDIKWKKTNEDIGQICNTQENILDSAAKLLKPGGVLVYSTCTIDPRENEMIVEQFLANHPEFRLDPEAAKLLPDHVVEQAAINSRPGMFRILPHYFGSDGFFMARLVRAGRNS